MGIACSRRLQWVVSNGLFLLLLLLGALAARRNGAVGVLAGWTVYVLNRRILLRCIEQGELPTLPARLRRNTALRMAITFAILAVTLKAIPAALGWAVGTWLLAQISWMVALAGLLREKGDEKFGD